MYICGLPQSSELLHSFLVHRSSLSSSIHFTIEIESENAIPFLDILVMRKETTLATQVYRKHTTLAVISASNLTIRCM
jgi:hypothetical protein